MGESDLKAKNRPDVAAATPGAVTSSQGKVFTQDKINKSAANLEHKLQQMELDLRAKRVNTLGNWKQR